MLPRWYGILLSAILADLRYLYKDEAYESEQEYRIIGVAEFQK